MGDIFWGDTVMRMSKGGNMFGRFKKTFREGDELIGGMGCDKPRSSKEIAFAELLFRNAKRKNGVEIWYSWIFYNK
jgi:hypothetical protein